MIIFVAHWIDKGKKEISRLIKKAHTLWEAGFQSTNTSDPIMQYEQPINQTLYLTNE